MMDNYCKIREICKREYPNVGSYLNGADPSCTEKKMCEYQKNSHLPQHMAGGSFVIQMLRKSAGRMAVTTESVKSLMLRVRM